MKEKYPLLITRKELLDLLGAISLSQLLRIEKKGALKSAKVKIGKRAVRYRVSTVIELINSNSLT